MVSTNMKTFEQTKAEQIKALNNKFPEQYTPSTFKEQP